MKLRSTMLKTLIFDNLKIIITYYIYQLCMHWGFGVLGKLTSEAFNPLFKEVKEVTIQELQAFIQKEFNYYSHFLN